MNHVCVLQDHAVNCGTAKLELHGCELHIEAEPVRQTLGQSQTVEAVVNVRHSDKQVEAWLRLGVELDATEALYRRKRRRRWWSEHLVARSAVKDQPDLPTFGLGHEEKADRPLWLQSWSEKLDAEQPPHKADQDSPIRRNT